MDRDRAIAEICRFLEEGGEVDGLTPVKVWRRAEIIEDPTRPGCIVFTLERHRALLGMAYRRGQPMEAFLKFWPKYALDLQSRTLDRIGKVRPTEVSVDYDTVAEVLCDLSFELEPTGDGKWRYHESCECVDGIVGNEEELEEVAAQLVEGLDFTSDVLLLSEWCSEAQAEQHVLSMKEAWKQRAREVARRNWKDAQRESEAR